MELIDKNNIKNTNEEDIVKNIDKTIDIFILSKSIETLREIIDKQLYIDTTPSNTTINAYEAIETVLQALDNSISKDKVKEKIDELNERIEKYREYTEQGIETDVEWVDNVADRQVVQVLKELLEDK